MALGHSVEEDEDDEETQRRPCSRGQIKGRNLHRTAESRSPSRGRAAGDWVRRCSKVSHDAERSYTGQGTGVPFSLFLLLRKERGDRGQFGSYCRRTSKDKGHLVHGKLSG